MTSKNTKPKKETASSMAARIREISISEFFSKNRHLLGFDNPLKSLLTAVREGVDNALDACEEADILPDIVVEIKEETKTHFRVSIEDNGPGILKTHLPNIFGKLLYGSKFHRLKQSRGQQGIGISAAVMYGQMTTGKNAEVISKTGKGKPAHLIKLHIDTKKNHPKIVSDATDNSAHWQTKESGTKITIVLEGAYKEGRSGVRAYMSQTALSNPHATFTFVDPKGERHVFPRLVNELPARTKEIKPHPHGLELGNLIQLLHDSKRKPIESVLKSEFSRVTEPVAKEILKGARLKGAQIAQSLNRPEADRLYQAIQDTKIMPPPTNCLSPLSEDSILKALYWLFVESKKWDDEETSLSAEDAPPPAPPPKSKGKKAKQSPKQADLFAEKEPEPKSPDKVIDQIERDSDGSLAADSGDYFVTAITRPPAVYRGNPFQIEVGLFYGKGLKADKLVQVFRYANRVPLQFQASACAMTKAMTSVPWKSYGLEQGRGALPTGPVVVMLHIASVWVPYTSESKEAIAHYPEILKDLRLALMEAGRRLQRFLRHKRKEADEAKKRSYIQKYLDPIGEALQDILGFSDKDKSLTLEQLEKILEKTRDKAPGAKVAKAKHLSEDA